MKRLPILPKQQRGIALLMAVLIAALVAALSIALTHRVQISLNHLQNQQDRQAGQRAVMAALDLARFALRDDKKNNQVDHLQEAWAIPLPPIPVEEGQVGGRIRDLQGFFNLANLVSSNKTIDRAAMLRFKRLLELLGLEPSLADRLEARIKEHLKKENPDASSTFPFYDLADLDQINGFDREIRRKLAFFVVILPEPSKINVNFVSPEVLAANLPNLSLGDANVLLAARSGKHFAKLSDFAQALPESARANFNQGLWSVESEFFSAEISALFGRAEVRYQALLSRSASAKMPDVIWLRRIYEGGVAN